MVVRLWIKTENVLTLSYIDSSWAYAMAYDFGNKLMYFVDSDSKSIREIYSVHTDDSSTWERYVVQARLILFVFNSGYARVQFV